MNEGVAVSFPDDLMAIAPIPMTVAVTGSRGLVGSALVPFLTSVGCQVVCWLRGGGVPTSDGSTNVNWDPDQELDPGLLNGIDGVVHLAGENIAAKRWTAEQKARIRDSRIGPTRRLAEAMTATGRQRVLISASAIGIYGDRGDEVLDESSPTGEGFLADVCRDWEAATEPARLAGLRVVNLRLGIVLSAKGGALAAQLPAFRWGVGADLGPGTQWVSWITIGDLVRAIYHALVTGSLEGPVNATTPGPVTNRDFGRTLARVLKRPYLLTLPRFALRAIFGEVADEAMLASTRVGPRKLLASGFTFEHGELEPALRALLGR